MICFDADGSFLSEKTNQELAARLSKVSKAVIPGFYGSMPDGSVKTFSRGGSDITGSLVARAVHADPVRELDRRVRFPGSGSQNCGQSGTH